MSLRVGVVGVGYLGQHHARIYAGLDDVELVGVADVDRKRAEEIASLNGCRAFADYRDLIVETDALSIVTPTTFHYEVALECLNAGRSLLVEKPITSTVREAEALIEVAGKKNVILQVGHLERYNPAVVSVVGLVKDPVYIESERVAPFTDRALDVDVTIDLMIHDIDIVMSLLGVTAVRDVRVVGAKVLTEKLDVAKAWVEFEGGVTALITSSRISRAKQRLLKLYQKDSFVILDYQEMKIHRHYRNGSGIGRETIEVESREPLKEEIVDFVRCVREGRRPLVSGVEGKNALEVALAITDKIKNAGAQ
jgi:predicted dehydrogenase